MGLTQEVPPAGKLHRLLDEKRQQIREPLLLRPHGSYQDQPQPLSCQHTVDYSADDCDGRKGVSLEILPWHGERVHLPGHGIWYWRAVHGETPIEGGGEQVDHRRPPDLEHRLCYPWMESPFRGYHLILTAELIG